jgi:predicted MFS family arabinose efflux permease
LQDSLQGLATVWAKGKIFLRSRSIWALSFGLAGFVAGSFVPIDYITQYFSTTHPSWGITTAAEIAAVGMGFTIPGGIVGGIVGERKIDRRAVLALSSVIFGACLLVLPYLNLTFLWFLYAIAGIHLGQSQPSCTSYQPI